MATFPRTVIPRASTWPSVPGPLISAGQSGKLQLRSTLQVGREWSESYGPYKSTDTTYRAWLAQILSYWQAGTVLDVDHRSMRDLLGAGGGTPLVQGGSQTGGSIVTDGWSNSTTVLRAGDAIKFAGLNLVYDVLANVTSTASGTATVTIAPNIVTGNSPADNAAITTNAVAGSVLFRAFLVSVRPSSAGPDGYHEGLELVFREAP